MSWYLMLRFLHIASAITLVGGIFARQFVRSVASTTHDVREFAALSRGAGRIESLMVIPGSLAVLVFGVILALISGAPILGFLQGASQNWLLLANVLLISGWVLVPFVFIPRGKQFDPILNDALAKGEMTPQLQAELDDPVVRFAHTYEMGSLVIIVALMVFKPF